MTLETGALFGSYEVVEQIGSGGMGEVYRARDRKLAREVAIKTLPSALAADKDSLARFEREARLLASLNHAHIASVYNFDEAEGTLYIAMELVDGETLEDRLKSGALPVEAALRLALQIAQALEAAHEKGVVHRDLKPANIMITPDGVVKVLDFGLAKAFIGDPDAASTVHSPALSAAMTQQGLILGTAGYMSPEQASGQVTDHRADIWSFGVVCYEMLAGVPVFGGESVPHILAGILKSEPEWGRLPERLHPRLALMLRRCLEKDIRRRYHSIADVRVDIETVLGEPDGIILAPLDGAGARQPALRLLAAFMFTIAVTAAISAVLTWRIRPDAETRGVAHLVEPIDMPQVGRRMHISRDGARAAFVGGAPPAIYVREIGSPGVRPVADTLDNPPEGAGVFCISPDGTWVAFETADTLRRAPVAGGSGVTIVERFGDMLDCDWADDGYVYFARRARDNGTIERVPFAGDDVELVAAPNSATGGFRRVQSLPGGARLLSTTLLGSIVIQDLASGLRTVLPGGTANARFVDTFPSTSFGHLVFVRDETMYAAPFDLENLVLGPETPVVEDVIASAVSSNGTLAYLTGTTPFSAIDAVDRQGNWTTWLEELHPYRGISLSPNGRHIVTGIDADLFVKDLSGGPLTPLFSALWPTWTPDGRRLVFSRLNLGPMPPRTIESVPIDRSEAPARLWGGDNSQILVPSSISPDGLTLLGTTDGPGGIWVMPVSDPPEERPDAELRLLLDTGGAERHASFSPDGRWVAFSSDQSGTTQVYVIRYPAPGEPQQVTVNGGRQPRWNPAGGELFYLDGARLMAVDVSTDGAFRVLGEPRLLIEESSLEIRAGVGTDWYYDVTPDGMQFVMPRIADDQEAGAGDVELHILVNWTEELKRRVPIG